MDVNKCVYSIPRMDITVCYDDTSMYYSASKSGTEEMGKTEAMAVGNLMCRLMEMGYITVDRRNVPER